MSAAVGSTSFTTVSVFFKADLSKEATAETDGGIVVGGVGLVGGLCWCR